MNDPKGESLKKWIQKRLDSVRGLWDVTKIYAATKREQIKRKHAARKEFCPVGPGAQEVYFTPRKDFRFFYDEGELDAILQYIKDAFGSISRVYYDADDPPKPRIDIALVDLSEDCDFYTLVTIGMGIQPMRDPSGENDPQKVFSELVIFLPPGWDFEKDTWPFQVLKLLARYHFDHFNQPILIEAGVTYYGEMMWDTPFDGVLFIPAATRDEIPYQLQVPNDKIINYYLLLPLYEDEVDYIRAHDDILDFWNLYRDRIGTVVVNPMRESCISELEDDEEEDRNN